MNPWLSAQPDNPMVRLDAVLQELRAAGKEVFDFGVGDPQEPTPAFIVDALKAAVPAISQYPRVMGTPALRGAIAGYLQRRFGVTLDPDREILPSSGAKEAIFHLPQLLIDPHGERRVVLYPDPGYPIYERGAAFAGGEPHPLRSEGGFPNLDELPATLLSRTAIFWICTPHNPTGAVASRDYLAALARLAARFGFVVASDECYADLYFEAPPPSILEVSRHQVLAFHSLSKRSGMTGMRSGFMAGDPDLIGALKRFRPAIGTASPEFVQAAAAAAWGDDRHVEERRVTFAAKRALFLKLFSDLGLSASGDAGLYLWLRCPSADDEGYARRLATGCGIVLQPGSYLGEGGRGQLRLALSPTLERCRTAVDAWRAFEAQIG